MSERMLPLSFSKTINWVFEEYKSESPHVTIAKKMKELGLPVDIGMLMQYYIAEPESHQKTKTGKKYFIYGSSVF